MPVADTDTDFVSNQHLNLRLATEFLVADWDYILESSNEMVSGI